MFKYILETEKKEEKVFNADEARSLWDALIYLKLRCPSLDIKQALVRVETYLPREETDNAAAAAIVG